MDAQSRVVARDHRCDTRVVPRRGQVLVAGTRASALSRHACLRTPDHRHPFTPSPIMKRSGSTAKVFAADMAVQKHRLETFDGASISSSASTSTKARGGGATAARSKSAKSSANSSSSSLLVKWPHPITDGRESDDDNDDDDASASRFPQPIHWASLGFFFSPTAEEPDRVVSFLDGVSISGFRPGDAAEDRLTEVQPDNPFLRMTESRAHAKDQGYASPGSSDTSKGEKSKQIAPIWKFPPDLLPTGSTQLQARKKTFGNLWPHDKKLGSNCTSEKLAEAGFYFDPTFSDPDGATCRLCYRALDGWSSDDDPVEEHRKKNADCPFFNCEEESERGQTSAQEEAMTASTSVKSTSSKGAKSRQVSTSTSKTASSAGDGELVDLTEDVQEVPRKRTNRGRPPKTKAKADTTTVEHDEPSTTAAGKKTTRGKATSSSSRKGKQVESVGVADESEGDADDHNDGRPATPEVATVVEDVHPPGPPQLSPRKTRSASRTKAKNPIASMSMTAPPKENMRDVRDVSPDPKAATAKSTAAKASSSRSKKGKKADDDKASASRADPQQSMNVEKVRDDDDDEHMADDHVVSVMGGDDDVPVEEEEDALMPAEEQVETDTDEGMASHEEPKATDEAVASSEQSPQTDARELGLGIAPPIPSLSEPGSSSTVTPAPIKSRVFSPIPKRAAEAKRSSEPEPEEGQEDSFHSLPAAAEESPPSLPPLIHFTSRSILSPITSLPTPISDREMDLPVREWLQGEMEKALREMRTRGQERLSAFDEEIRGQRIQLESIWRGRVEGR